LSKNKRGSIGGPNNGRVGLIGVLKYKWKSPMQPFAHLPRKTKVRGKTPLDVKESHMKWKTIHELVGAIHRIIYSSNNEVEESDFPKGSSGAEVKEDVDYKGD
jgi:hypothetical protein